jgi:2,4-dienoyl-CoA reductase-like NADH-dependent reductase (Old Yellow Enzyme family)
VQSLQAQLDYVHIVAGTSASLGGAVHIVPPMAIEAAYLAREAGTFKAGLDIPLFVTGRINQPQEAELIIARGQADVCGMTRALICDPQMPNKTDAAALKTYAPASPAIRRASATSTRAADFLHPAPGNRTRTDLRRAPTGQHTQTHHDCRRRPGRDESRGCRCPTRARGDAV